MTAVVGHDAAQDREAGDQRFEKFSGAAWVDWSHTGTVSGGDAHVTRGMKNLYYDSVAIEAESSGGVLRVWKTTQ